MQTAVTWLSQARNARIGLAILLLMGMAIGASATHGDEWWVATFMNDDHNIPEWRIPTYNIEWNRTTSSGLAHKFENFSAVYWLDDGDGEDEEIVTLVCGNGQFGCAGVNLGQLTGGSCGLGLATGYGDTWDGTCYTSGFTTAFVSPPQDIKFRQILKSQVGPSETQSGWIYEVAPTTAYYSNIPMAGCFPTNEEQTSYAIEIYALTKVNIGYEQVSVQAEYKDGNNWVGLSNSTYTIGNSVSNSPITDQRLAYYSDDPHNIPLEVRMAIYEDGNLIEESSSVTITDTNCDIPQPTPTPTPTPSPNPSP